MLGRRIFTRNCRWLLAPWYYGTGDRLRSGGLRMSSLLDYQPSEG